MLYRIEWNAFGTYLSLILQTIANKAHKILLNNCSRRQGGYANIIALKTLKKNH